MPTRQLLQASGNEPEEPTDISEPSSSDSEEEIDVQEELQDPEFLRLLARAKGQEAASTDRLAEAQEEEAAGKVKKRKRERPVRLKDIHPQGDEEAAELAGHADAASTIPYAEELEASRQDFLKAASSGSEEADDELFAERPLKTLPMKTHKAGDPSMQLLLDQFFGKDEDLSPDDLFLKKFIRQPGQDDKLGQAKSLANAWQMQDDLEDEAHLEEAERFEAAHNFRFQEPGAGAVKTYPRVVDGVVREGDMRRAEARARKKQRKAELEAKQQAEVQRQKNATRRDIETRLQEIQKHSGMPAVDTSLETLLAANDFNEAEYDKTMEKIFGAAYYEADDKETPEGGTSSSSDEEAGLEKPTEPRAKLQGEAPLLQSLAGEASLPAKDAAAVQRLLDEYHKLDYEEMVAGVPMKFPYKKVEKMDYGLSTAEILSLSDKELNQIIGLKRLAPYRHERNSRKGHYQARHRLSQLRQGKLQEKSEARPAGTGASEKLLKSAQTEKESVRARRLATYAKPQLRKKAPPKAAPSGAAEVSLGPVLSKAQKRNLRRSRIRTRSLAD